MPKVAARNKKKTKKNKKKQKNKKNEKKTNLNPSRNDPPRPPEPRPSRRAGGRPQIRQSNQRQRCHQPGHHPSLPNPTSPPPAGGVLAQDTARTQLTQFGWTLDLPPARRRPAKEREKGKESEESNKGEVPPSPPIFFFSFSGEWPIPRSPPPYIRPPVAGC